MALFVNRLKLRAAAGSMHQFCSRVRSIFPTPPKDQIVEAATMYLYLQVAREVFGRRFAAYLRAAVRPSCKFASAPEIDSLVARIEQEVMDRNNREPAAATRSTSEAVAQRILGAIDALFVTAGLEMHRDSESLRAAYPRFEDAVRSIKRHLTGIHDQSRFVMR